jgi:hypothetical protein
MRRRRSPFPILLAVGCLVIMVIGFVSCSVQSFTTNDPKEVIEEFYKSERDGEFGQSWELFHSEMKKKFKKSSYIQTKNHVFMGHMEVDTFDVEIGDLREINKWKFSKDGPSFKEVKAADVDLTFESQFGLLTITQTCYVAKDDGEWRVLWDYNF